MDDDGASQSSHPFQDRGRTFEEYARNAVDSDADGAETKDNREETIDDVLYSYRHISCSERQFAERNPTTSFALTNLHYGEMSGTSTTNQNFVEAYNQESGLFYDKCVIILRLRQSDEALRDAIVSVFLDNSLCAEDEFKIKNRATLRPRSGFLVVMPSTREQITYLVYNTSHNFSGSNVSSFFPERKLIISAVRTWDESLSVRDMPIVDGWCNLGRKFVMTRSRGRNTNDEETEGNDTVGTLYVVRNMVCSIYVTSLLSKLESCGKQDAQSSLTNAVPTAMTSSCASEWYPEDSRFEFREIVAQTKTGNTIIHYEKNTEKTARMADFFLKTGPTVVSWHLLMGSKHGIYPRNVAQDDAELKNLVTTFSFNHVCNEESLTHYIRGGEKHPWINTSFAFYDCSKFV